MATIRLPDRKNLHTTKQYGDCSGYYYVPGLRVFYLKRIEMIMRLIESRGGSVLDIGCGSGILFYQLRKIFSELNGMDLRKDINKTKELLAAGGVKADLVNGDLFHMPYKDESFDCVIAMSVLEHIADMEKPVREVRRVLRKGGSFLCGIPVKNFCMRMFFKLVKFNDEKDHPSGHRYIYDSLRSNFTIERVIRFPFFLKMDHCLYIACRCRKE